MFIVRIGDHSGIIYTSLHQILQFKIIFILHLHILF